MKQILLIALFAPLFSIAQTHVVLQTNNVYGGQSFYADGQEHGYTDWYDNAVKFSRASYYMSQLKVSDGNAEEALSESHILVKSEITEYYLGTTTLSEVTELIFGLGVEESMNHLDPASYPSNHPLAHQTPNMHWGWSAGYKFVVLEGNADDNGDGTPNAVFQFHCLDDDNYQENVSVETSATTSNDTLYLKINVDHRGWFQNVNVPSAGILHGSHPETDQVMLNGKSSPVFTAFEPLTVEESASLDYTFVDYRKPYAPSIRYVFEGVRSVDIQITDINGKIIESKSGLNPQGEFSVWSEPATGIYLYSFSSNGKVLATERFTVTR